MIEAIIAISVAFLAGIAIEIYVLSWVGYKLGKLEQRPTYQKWLAQQQHRNNNGGLTH